MKIHFLAFIAALFAFVAGEVFEELRANVSSPIFQNDTVKVAAFDNPADQQLWQKSICRGQRLFLAMTFDLPEAGRICQPIISPWDGTLERELITWGYSDISDDIEHEFDCDMSPDKNGIEDMLEEINADPNDSRHGGDNICHALQHRDGTVVERDEIGNLPDEEDQYYNVNGREYRITGAFFEIGVNPRAGIIYFLNRESPEVAARGLWLVPSVSPDEMPALRSSSDIAWGLWNRDSPGSLSNINYFFSVNIVNDDTLALIHRVMINENHNYMPYAPGVTFYPGSDSFVALLGSPNAIGAAYFLAQHKPQFGHNRYITEITLFMGNGPMELISMMMKVERAPPQPPLPPFVSRRDSAESTMSTTPTPLSQKSSKMTDTALMKRGHDREDFVREHLIWG